MWWWNFISSLAIAQTVASAFVTPSRVRTNPVLLVNIQGDFVGWRDRNLAQRRHSSAPIG
jgi:hypothetical protein